MPCNLKRMTKLMKETLEEALTAAQITPGKRMFAIRPESLTLESVRALCGALPEGATVLMVRPPFVIVEAEDLDPSVGGPIDGFADLVQDGGDELEADAHAGPDGDRGEGYEITAEDWDNVLLLCSGHGGSIADVDIGWLIETGLAKRTSGGHPEPSPLALNWTNQAKTDNHAKQGS